MSSIVCVCEEIWHGLWTLQHSSVQWHALLWSWYDLTHTVALPTEFWVLDSVDWSWETKDLCITTWIIID